MVEASGKDIKEKPLAMIHVAVVHASTNVLIDDFDLVLKLYRKLFAHEFHHLPLAIDAAPQPHVPSVILSTRSTFYTQTMNHAQEICQVELLSSRPATKLSNIYPGIAAFFHRHWISDWETFEQVRFRVVRFRKDSRVSVTQLA